MPRTSAKDFAYQVGRQARIERLDLRDANVRLAYKLSWVCLLYTSPSPRDS